jgi:hypothetical protein
VELNLVDRSAPLIATPLSHAGITDLFVDAAAQAQLAADLQRATDLKVLGIRGWHLFGPEDALVRPLLTAKGPEARLRLLLLNPRSAFVRPTAQLLKVAPQSLRAGIREVLECLETVRQHTAAEVAYRVYDDLPLWRLVFADSTLYVGSYLRFFPAGSGQSSAQYRIVKQEPP